jgi:hypothetical protein
LQSNRPHTPSIRATLPICGLFIRANHVGAMLDIATTGTFGFR